VTNKRYVGQVDQEGWGGALSLGQISPEIPHQLKRQLYQRLLNQINDASRLSEQITALVRLGDFFIKAFGTEASLAEALKWYVRASERGSKEAMAMIFRLERVLRRPVKDMFSTITTETRSAWMVECLLSTIKKEFDPKLAPAGTKFVEAESKMRQVLNNNPWLAEVGLRRDLDYAIVKIRTMKRPTPRIGTDVAFLPGLANASCKGEILQAIVYDLPEMLNDTLQSNPNLEFLKPRLFRFAAEMGAVRTIRILAEKHRCNVEFIDFESGQRYSSLVEAAIRSDLPVFIALAQCGADYTCLMDREAMDQIIRTAPDLIMREAFNAVLGKEATEPIRELYDPINICHQFIDGVCPAAIFSRQEGEKRIPPDNTNSPPVFEAILFNQLDKLQSLLTRGGNPNVCFQGLTALHYAVRLCRPMAALLLMAFGADPNARNSSSGYGTPLHALSEKTIKPGSGKAYEDGKHFRNTDFLLRDYEPLPETQGEFDNQRLLILQLLRAYGAKSDVLCIDGYTPLMTVIASPACSAPGVVSNFMTAGVSMADKSLRGESVFHICVLARNSSALRKLLRSADVEAINSPDNNGATPLFIAAVQNGMGKIIKILLEAGSDVAIRGPDGLTPLDVAMIEGQVSNVMTILDHLDEVPLANRLPMLAGSPVTSRNAFHFLTYLPNQNRMVEVLRRVLSWSSETEPILSKDQWGFSAIDYARHRNAQSALRLFNEHLQFNSVVIKEKVPDPEWKLIQDAVESTKSYRQKINSSKSNGQAHTEFCHQSQEEIGGTLQGQPRLTPAEIGHLKVLEATIRERGERDPETIWCMNNLGTVHERYGRLSRAQDILYRGWTVSKEALGNEDLVTKDFACKFLRVIRDRGLEGVEGADVTNWHAEHGQNTLNTAFEILNFPEAPSEEEYSRMTVFGRGKVTASVCSCDREMCLNVSLINCPGKQLPS
jgi:ankyrin repeat protein